MKQVLGRTLQTDNRAYEIYRLVASGGFAGVFFGRDLRTNATVAVKILHPHHARDARALAMFEEEGRRFRGLQHPHIVQILDQGRDDDDVPFIVMEWVPGWTVAELIRERGAYPPGEAATVGRGSSV